MQFSILGDEPDLLKVQCSGEITQQFIPPNINPLSDQLGGAGFTRRVIVNMDKTRFVDSSGISWLLENNKRFKTEGGRLVLYGIPPLVRQVFDLMKMSTVLFLAKDETEARRLAQEGKA